MMRFLKSFDKLITDEERLALIFEAFSEKYLYWGVDLFIKDAVDQIQVQHLNFVNHNDVKVLVKREIERHHIVPARNWLIGKCNQIKDFELRQNEFLEEPVDWNSRYAGLLYELEMSPEPPLLSLEETLISLNAIGLQKIIIAEEGESISVESVIDRPLVQAEWADMSQFGQQLYEIEFLRQNIERIVAKIIEKPCFALPTEIEWSNGERLAFWNPKDFQEGKRVGVVLLIYFGLGDQRLKGLLGYLNELAARVTKDEKQSLLTLVEEFKLIQNPIERTR